MGSLEPVECQKHESVKFKIGPRMCLADEITWGFSNHLFLATNARSRVVDNFDSVGGGNWSPSIHRNPNDWELHEWLGLMGKIGECSLNPSVRDSWKWGLIIGAALLPSPFMMG